jgi:hypothetical protein
MSANLSEMPATAAEWHKQIVDADLEDWSIFDFDAYDSASKITHHQFLLLRVLWLKKDQNVFFKNCTKLDPQARIRESKMPTESH